MSAGKGDGGVPKRNEMERRNERERTLDIAARSAAAGHAKNKKRIKTSVCFVPS